MADVVGMFMISLDPQGEHFLALASYRELDEVSREAIVNAFPGCTGLDLRGRAPIFMCCLVMV